MCEVARACGSPHADAAALVACAVVEHERGRDGSAQRLLSEASRKVADPLAREFSSRFRTYDAAQVTFDAAAEAYDVDRDADGLTDFSFGNPDFNVKALRTNAVLRWEYRPGSTLFLVWSQGRSRFDPFGNYDFSRDTRDLFAAQPTNVLLLKVSYWMGL